MVNSQQAQFGLVRENGGWRILSLGLVLLDIPELSKQWAEQDMAEREDAIVTALQGFTRSDPAVQARVRKTARLARAAGSRRTQAKFLAEQASLVSKELAAGAAGGYHFRYRVISTADPNNQTFELAATPDDYGKTGRRSFFQDGAGRIHAADKHGAAATSGRPAA